MTRYVVAVQLTRIDKIELDVIEAPTWKEALTTAIIIIGEAIHRSTVTLMDGVSLEELKYAAPKWIGKFPDDVQEARKLAHKQNWDFNIKEIA